MELINRENILRYIDDLQRTETMTPDTRKLMQAVWRCAAAAVDYSGEYVPVVRCRDCEFYWNELSLCCNAIGLTAASEEAYCSYGERRGK